MGGARTTLFVIVALVAPAVRAENPCADCHSDQVAAVAQTVHRRVAQESARFCVACHGDPAKHLESGEAKDILGRQALAALPEEDKSAACLSCHQASWPSWESSAHQRGKVSCWQCHAGVWHRAVPRTEASRSIGVCASCHGDVTAAFRSAWHHPVAEGKMSCVSCHDVHGEQPPEELAFDRCAQCHPQAAGPFVFPHRAIEEEGCTACHTPHGSVNRSLLRSSGNGLCLRCHVQSNFPGVGKVPHNFQLLGGGRCYDCHSEVHGSNVNDRLAPRLER